MNSSDYPLIINPDKPHMACLFLIDTSMAMNGEIISNTAKIMNAFREEVRKNKSLCEILDVSIVEFNSTGRVLQEFVPVEYMGYVCFVTSGTSDLNNGLRMAIDRILERHRVYHKIGTLYYVPWLVLITDNGMPDAHIEDIAEKISGLEKKDILRLFVMGTKGSNIDNLRDLWIGKRVVHFDECVLRTMFDNFLVDDGGEYYYVDQNMYKYLYSTEKIQSVDIQGIFNIGIILCGKSGKNNYEDQVTDLIKSLREYSNEFILYPKHVRNLEIDSTFPQIVSWFSGKDYECESVKVEELAHSQLTITPKEQLVPTCKELFGKLNKSFRQSLDNSLTPSFYKILVITDGDFLEIVSEIKRIKELGSNFIVVGLSDNYWCCYDKNSDELIKIYHMSQIADILLFNKLEGYTPPAPNSIFEHSNYVESPVIDEEWL